MKPTSRNTAKGEVKTAGERELSFLGSSVSSWSEDEYSKGLSGKALDRRPLLTDLSQPEGWKTDFSRVDVSR